MIRRHKKLCDRWECEPHSEEQHLSLRCGVHHVGLRDRAALTKPCGNTRGTVDRCEERGSVTDGQTVAATRERVNER